MLRTLVEQMGRGVDGWKLKAALEAVDVLIRHLFAICHGEIDQPLTEAWGRIILLASLLGYRDLLAALGGNSCPMAARLAEFVPDAASKE